MKIKYIVILLIFNFIFVSSVRGVEVGFNENYQEILVNQEFKVSIVINTDNKSINAIEGEIIIPKDILTLTTINYDNSKILLWMRD